MLRSFVGGRTPSQHGTPARSGPRPFTPAASLGMQAGRDEAGADTHSDLGHATREPLVNTVAIMASRASEDAATAPASVRIVTPPMSPRFM